jgi:hypothetical protein
MDMAPNRDWVDERVWREGDFEKGTAGKAEHTKKPARHGCRRFRDSAVGFEIEALQIRIFL